jgi:TIR domain
MSAIHGGDYSFDVFISYPRRLYQQSEDETEHACGQWLRSLFLPFFKSCLSDLLPHSPHIFLDVDEIQAGDKWLEVLRRALSVSRCLVPVWSPPYFRSPHCLWEWQTFLRRGPGVVVPIGWTKSFSFFPDEARATQIYDFSRYAFPNPALMTTRKGMPFYESIRDFAERVAQAVLASPAFVDGDPRFQPGEIPAAPPRPALPLIPLGATGVGTAVA